jgi:hypothetical protein
MARPIRDLRDYQNEYWKVISLVQKPPQSGKHAEWMCMCKSCGKERIIRSSVLLKSGTKQGARCDCIEGFQPCKLEPGEAGFRELVRRYKGGAKLRGYSWELSDDQVRSIVSKPCAYCGVSGYLNTRIQYSKKNKASESHRKYITDRSSFVSNGIDRVDNNVGYVYDNCVACCTRCNELKQSYSLENFLGWIKQIMNNTIFKETLNVS